MGCSQQARENQEKRLVWGKGGQCSHDEFEFPPARLKLWAGGLDERS